MPLLALWLAYGVAIRMTSKINECLFALRAAAAVTPAAGVAAVAANATRLHLVASCDRTLEQLLSPLSTLHMAIIFDPSRDCTMTNSRA
jgi:cellulase/cellobiase CelA1